MYSRCFNGVERTEHQLCLGSCLIHGCVVVVGCWRRDITSPPRSEPQMFAACQHTMLSAPRPTQRRQTTTGRTVHSLTSLCWLTETSSSGSQQQRWCATSRIKYGNVRSGGILQTKLCSRVSLFTDVLQSFSSSSLMLPSRMRFDLASDACYCP